MKQQYRAIVSSDWNECLAPCGPFDYIAFTFPELLPTLNDIFQSYTGNHISLKNAMQQVRALLPKPVNVDQMDAYLDDVFSMYTGVTDLMEWCHSRKILFMLNTTGAIGYFQRAFFKKLLPPLPVISAYPEPHFSKEASDPGQVYPLCETTDKGRHTEKVARKMGIPLNRIVVMGDSGGDGPHFKWGAENGAFLIGCMSKPSLQHYCKREGIKPDFFFGRAYRNGETIDPALEMGYNFMDLAGVIEDALDLGEIINSPYGG